MIALSSLSVSGASGELLDGELRGNEPSGEWFSAPQIAQIWGYSTQTVRRMANRGKLPCRKDPDSPFSHRRIHRDDAYRVLGVPRSEGEKGEKCVNVGDRSKPVAIYARVSSAKQSKSFHLKSKDSDLARQVEKLKGVCLNRWGAKPKVYSDTNSGLSFTRKGLEALMKAMLAGELDNGIVVCTTKDRLCRFGAELIFLVGKSRGIEFVFSEKEENQSEDETAELSSDIIAILTHFSARIHGKRSAKTCSAPLPPDCVKEALRMKKEGLKSSQAAKLLAAKGYKNEKGRAVNHYSVQALWDKAGDNLDGLLDEVPTNSFEEWSGANLVADPNAKGQIMAFYKLYKSWCEGQGKTPITWRAAQMWIADHFKFEAVKEHRTYQVRLKQSSNGGEKSVCV